jgi:GT2 family glycosyltransferase
VDDITIAIATYGDQPWEDLAVTRAVPSAMAQDVPVVHVHNSTGANATLHQARNRALELVHTEWVIHLDADDELEPGYVDAMRAGTADVRAPIVRYLHTTGREHLWSPRVAGHTHQCDAECLVAGNWLIIGSMVRTQMVRRVGGWRDFAWSEDWDLWLRCHLAGATIESIPDAVYRAHVRLDSRNRGASQEAKLAAHRAIAEANGLVSV